MSRHGLGRFTITAFLLAALFPAAGAAADLRALCAGPAKSETQLVGSSGHAYTVRMGGSIDSEMTRDPLGYWAYDQYWEGNVSVRLENVGDVPVVNPWIRREGRPDTRTLRSIVDFVVTPAMSDREKARRLYEFDIRQRFHATTNDEEVDDVVKRFNAYGYTLCGNQSKIIGDLWRAAGLRVRRGYPAGHSTTEVFYDGDWHLLDSDEGIICLMRDNKTIASEAQIVADHDLMKRTHTYNLLQDDNRIRDEDSASGHHYEGTREGEHPSRTKHTMNFVLRPGEALTWAWNPRNRVHLAEDPRGNTPYWLKRWRVLTHAMNGELSYTPDLTRQATMKFFEGSGVEWRAGGPMGTGVYLSGRSGSLLLPVNSAYPIVGGRLDVDFMRRDTAAEKVKVSLSFDGGRNWRDMWTSLPTDYSRMGIDLDEFFPMTEPARYGYLLRFELDSRAEKPELCLKGISLHSTLQMARLAMPGLSLGENAFRYTDESGPERKVRITHVWNECGAAEVPGRPERALAPEDGATAPGTRVNFRWEPPASGAAPADYEFELSEYADMRWPLSPNFHKLISRTVNRGKAAYDVPYHGLLNPGETYYWRVRARSREGVWGAWSKAFSFSAAAPAVPVSVSGKFDPQARAVAVRWEPGKGGTAPARYRVYGSAERGFTASDVPYVYAAGAAGTRDSPPNLLLETSGPVNSVELPPDLWRAYYRVAAVDAAGRESGPSDMTELAHPLIMTRKLPDGRPSSYYQAAVEVSASIGHLTPGIAGAQPPSPRMHRTGDDLAFELSGAPAGLSVQRKTGLIAGYLPSGSAGQYEMLVTVTDRKTGTRDAVKLPLRIDAGVAQNRAR
jgi:hypothetical protein